jgi:hypothetical protein
MFVDGQILQRVFAISDIHDDTWFQNQSSGEISIGFDPTGHKFELSHAETAFAGAATSVVLRGLTIERFASIAQHGAIQGDLSSGWIIENDVVRQNAGAGVRTGSGMHIVGSRVLANGQIGIVGAGDDMIVENNEIADNNAHSFSPSWEAGGTKFVRTVNLLVRGNYVHHNNGPGLWTDIDNRDSTVVDNISNDNGGVGIMHEISGRALIASNEVMRNGTREEESPWSSQILVSGSIDTIVWNNRVAVAPDYGFGIYVVEEGRANTSKIVSGDPTYDSRDNAVTDNEIRFLGDHGTYGYHAQGPAAPTSLETRNRFARNTVVAPDGRLRFVGNVAAQN